MTSPVAALVDATGHGDRAALARLLTIVESGGEAARDALAALPPTAAGHAAVVGLTGAPGAGKSTLTDGLVGRLRGAGERVAVIAVDPTSPFTGGAILGDRVRMQDHDTDDGVFVRSMATRGELGGLSRAAPHAVRVLDAAGYAWILVETVGVGQVEVAVAGTADTTVVVVTPGWGDAIQASKAGLLEIGDVFVVNKADRGGVEVTVNDLHGMLMLGASVEEPQDGPREWVPPIVPTVAIEGRGLDELVDAVTGHRRYLEASGELARRRELRVRDELRGIVLERVAKRADDICSGARFDSVAARVAAGVVDPYTAATELVDDQT
ncbi:MAG: methylmalonyl Co-A mutase-associated GTPase MeaB [Acidimicrobiia bacterium]